MRSLVAFLVLATACLTAHAEPLSRCAVPGLSAGPEPMLLAPGIVSTGDQDTHAQFSHDGTTLYFLKGAPQYTSWTIVETHARGGRWSEPQVAPFSGAYSDADPFITSDGRQLFFVSNRPENGQGAPRPDMDIWVMDRAASGWGPPRRLPAPVNSDKDEWFPSVTRAGTLYFGSSREGGQGGSDIYRAVRTADGYAPPENLGAPVNTPGEEFEPLISPDEGFLILAAARQGGLGSMDLYVTYRRGGAWTAPRSLGAQVNTPGREIGPKFSPDGRLFVFSSGRNHLAPKGERMDYARLVQRLRGPQNGLGDLYVMDAQTLGIEGYSTEAMSVDACRPSPGRDGSRN